MNVQPDGPLVALSISAADWPAARAAGGLLAALGANVRTDLSGTALRRGDDSVRAAPTTAAEDWGASGAMTLTGGSDGPALHPTGAPATLARAATLAIELLSLHCGRRITVDGAALLGERAALTARGRAGNVSVGGASRLLHATDGQFALTLSRPDDVDLVPALVERDVTGDPWAVVSAWAAERCLADVAARLELVGLPFGVVPTSATTDEPPWTLRRLGPAAPPPARPLVVNLGSLWAGPLCAHLLALAGADVVHVESPQRPDGARQGTPAFYDLLHAGHDRVEIDLTRDLDRLHRLVEGADVVLTGSRVGALMRLGIDPDVRPGPRVWTRITAHGPDSQRVGFGDDAAAAAGLVARDGDAVMFAGDAIADPLAGLLSAVAVLGCLESSDGWSVDVSLHGAAAYAVGLGPTSGPVTARSPHVAAREVQPLPTRT